METLRPLWSSLNKHPDADIDVFSVLTCRESGVEKPFVLLLSQHNEPQALLVGRLQRCRVPVRIGYLTLFHLRVRQLTFIADGPQGYLGESAPGVAQVFTGQILELLKTKIADRAVFFKLRDNTELYAVARKQPGWWQRDYAGEARPRWAMSVPPTFDDFLKQASSKRRWQLRNNLRVIEKAFVGGVKCKSYQRDSDIDEFCTQAESVARFTYQRGLGVGFLNSAEDKQRLRLWAEKGWLKAYVLSGEDKPIAFWCGVTYKDIWYSVWTGYNPAQHNLHPGTVLLLKILEDLCGSNVKEVDFGFGEAEYKERFGDRKQVETFVNIHAGSLKGMAVSFVTIADAVINRSAKSLFARLKVMGRIKKLWRRKLATAATKQSSTIDARE